jgi:hypothetical protein
LTTTTVQVLYSYFVSNHATVSIYSRIQTHVKVVVAVNDLVARLS